MATDRYTSSAGSPGLNAAPRGVQLPGKPVVSKFDKVRLFATLLSGMLVLHVPVIAADPVYKYRERGLITYQDRAPSSRQDDGHSVLNNQGVVLREVLGRDARRLALKQERERELARIRDRALLATFTTEDDLNRTRDDRIGMIDGLISRLDDRIRILSDRLDIIDRRILLQEETNGPGQAPENLYAEQVSIQRNIENAWSLIDSKAAERKGVADKFDDDLIRYRELKAGISR